MKKFNWASYFPNYFIADVVLYSTVAWLISRFF